MSLRRHRGWGEFYAEERLGPMAELAAPRLDAATRDAALKKWVQWRAEHPDS